MTGLLAEFCNAIQLMEITGTTSMTTPTARMPVVKWSAPTIVTRRARRTSSGRRLAHVPLGVGERKPQLHVARGPVVAHVEVHAQQRGPVARDLPGALVGGDDLPVDDDGHRHPGVDLDHRHPDFPLGRLPRLAGRVSSVGAISSIES